MRLTLCSVFLSLVATAALAQVRDDQLCQPTLAPRATGAQVADESWEPRVPSPAFAVGQGPKVLLDEAHHNMHTVGGRYAPFVKLLRRDGFVVEPSRMRFTRQGLADAKILVIANAEAERNPPTTYIPARSAFAPDEIEAVRDWIEGGGSLFLIADHMPWGGEAASLAAAFGLMFTSGYATDAACGADEFLFQRADGGLADHPITRGRNQSELVTAVRTITGQAFRATGPDAVSPLLTLASKTVLLFPSQPWRFDPQTPRMSADGMLQGAVLLHGQGRVAAFGEAAMFSAQVSGQERRPMGMNMPTASQNPQFLLNVAHWLAGILPAR